jgi:hypothetical protein
MVNQVKQAAVEFAAANGDAAPAEVVIATGTREAAVKATMGVDVDTNQDVVVVVLKGHFIAYSATRPPGTTAPTGSYMELVFDPSTSAITDWGVQNTPYDLSALEPVTTLLN